MKFDKVDKIIIQTLKKEEVANMSRLIIKSFARESTSTFKKRLDRLAKKNVITIAGGCNSRKTGNSYTIKLKNKNRKV